LERLALHGEGLVGPGVAGRPEGEVRPAIGVGEMPAIAHPDGPVIVRSRRAPSAKWTSSVTSMNGLPSFGPVNAASNTPHFSTVDDIGSLFLDRAAGETGNEVALEDQVDDRSRQDGHDDRGVELAIVALELALERHEAERQRPRAV